LTDDERAALRRLVIARSTEKAAHIGLAIEAIASHPDCLPETRDKILAILDRAARERRAPVWPPSLRREAHVARGATARARGPKHSQTEVLIRRGDFWIDADGQKLPLRPHTIWESDDKSEDVPFSYIDPATGELTIGRQVLQTRDVYSAAWLSLTSVGRDKDA